MSYLGVDFNPLTEVEGHVILGKDKKVYTEPKVGFPVSS